MLRVICEKRNHPFDRTGAETLGSITYQPVRHPPKVRAMTDVRLIRRHKFQQLAGPGSRHTRACSQKNGPTLCGRRLSPFPAWSRGEASRSQGLLTVSVPRLPLHAHALSLPAANSHRNNKNPQGGRARVAGRGEPRHIFKVRPNYGIGPHVPVEIC